MKVTFEPAAQDDLDRIFAWIAKDNSRAALEMIARIERRVMRLENRELTHMGRPGLIEGTRELLEWPYIIVLQDRRRSSGNRHRFNRAWRTGSQEQGAVAVRDVRLWQH
jgi:toxin ParE1/3/4